MTIRKVGSSQFIETVTTEGSQVLASRSYRKWEDVDGRLREIGLSAEETAKVRLELDSGVNAVQIPLSR